MASRPSGASRNFRVALRAVRLMSTPMREWTIKAAPTNTNCSDVRGFGVSGFVHCTPCRANGKSQPNAQDVQIRDVLHLYFAMGREPVQAIGSFEVVSYKEHRHAAQFRDKWSGIPIIEVLDVKLCKALTLAGYKRDPYLNVFAGWCVRALRRATPEYSTTRLVRAKPSEFVVPYP